MSRSIRHRSLTKSIKARTTAKYKRQLKKKIIPGYGKKGAGVIKDPKRSMHNAIYSRTTIDSRDLGKSKNKSKSNDSDEKMGCGCAIALIFLGALVGQLIGGDIGSTIGIVLMFIISILGMI